MSLTRQITVWCDQCGNWDQASMTAANLRKELSRKGWTTVHHYNVRDYCPTCSAKRVEAAKELEELGEHHLDCAARMSNGHESCDCPVGKT